VRTPSVRARYYIALVLWLVFVFGLLVVASRGAEYLAWLLPVAVLAFGAYSMSLKCPHCHKPIGQSRHGPFWTPWTPADCRHCGLPVARR